MDIQTVAVTAKVGPDTTGITVISAGGPAYYTDSEGQRWYFGNVWADPSDSETIRRIVGVSAGCDWQDVALVLATPLGGE